MKAEPRDEIPKFNQEDPTKSGGELVDFTGVAGSLGRNRTAFEAGVILLVALLFLGSWELLLLITGVPSYVLPKPSGIFSALVGDFAVVYWPHLLITLSELGIGFFVGAAVGLVLAASITQYPFLERVITPYILLAVTTPMIALVPLLMLKLGFGIAPRVVAVALAVGPMVMINAATGFRRTDAAKIALARSYGASTLQIFTKLRVPMAMPMVIVGLLIGSIFGLLTAVGAEMIGGNAGLGNRLVYFASLARMEHFFATILIVALTGISLYVIFYFAGKKWASWQA